MKRGTAINCNGVDFTFWGFHIETQRPNFICLHINPDDDEALQALEQMNVAHSQTMTYTMCKECTGLFIKDQTARGVPYTKI